MSLLCAVFKSPVAAGTHYGMIVLITILSDFMTASLSFGFVTLSAAQGLCGSVKVLQIHSADNPKG